LEDEKTDDFVHSLDFDKERVIMNTKVPENDEEATKPMELESDFEYEKSTEQNSESSDSEKPDVRT
jgi:hypothetical protein